MPASPESARGPVPSTLTRVYGVPGGLVSSRRGEAPPWSLLQVRVFPPSCRAAGELAADLSLPGPPAVLPELPSGPGAREQVCSREACTLAGGRERVCEGHADCVLCLHFVVSRHITLKYWTRRPFGVMCSGQQHSPCSLPCLPPLQRPMPTSEAHFIGTSIFLNAKSCSP